MAQQKQFTSSRLKIQRSSDHIRELEAAFQRFLQTDFCQLIVESDSRTGDQFIKVVSVDSPSPEISLVVGDIVHNLRSALDHAIVSILGERGNQISFPVTKDRDNPGSHIAFRTIRHALPDLATLLTDKICIHDTGEPCLWAIGALDNLDKHNLLIAVASIYELRGICLEDKVRNNRITNMTARLSEGGVVNLVRYGGGGLEVTSKGQPAAALLFGQGQPLEGRPIVPTLLKLIEITTQTIEMLELFWFTRSPAEGSV